MRKLKGKILPLFVIAMFASVLFHLDAKAEVVWNWNHEYYGAPTWDANIGDYTTTPTPYKYKAWLGRSWSYVGIGSFPTEEDRLIPITYEVTYNYEEAYKMLDLVNAERRKAGVPELKANDRMMQIAMERAAQTNYFWEHKIPDGTGIHQFSMYIIGENLHRGSLDAGGANESLVESSGHHQNMISTKWTHAGFGCVGGNWVQIFCNKEDDWGRNTLYEVDGYPDKPIDLDTLPYGQLKNYTEQYTAYVNPKLTSMKMNFKIEGAEEQALETKRVVGEKATFYAIMSSTASVGDYNSSVHLVEGSYTITSSDPTVAEVKNGILVFKKAGEVTITATLNADPSITATKEIEVKDKPVEDGDERTVGNNVYKVSSTKKKTVSFVGVEKDTAKVTIPDTVKIQGKSYKVTAIAANAFKGKKKLTTVTIGKNVTTIGKNAFSGCSKLKDITVKTTKLKSAGKNALKGIHKKAVIKVPNSSLTKYKKLLKGKGQKKTVKIK